MDRNSIIGLLLIFAVLMGYTLWMTPSKEELEAKRKQQDSLFAVQQMKDSLASINIPAATTDTTGSMQTQGSGSNGQGKPADTSAMDAGIFSNATSGADEDFIIENDLLKINISSRGGRISQVELKNFKTFDGLPLVLFTADSSDFRLSFFANNRLINTGDLFFSPAGERPENNHLVVSGDDSIVFSMRVYAGNRDSAATEASYIEYRYIIPGNQYMLGFDVNFQGLGQTIAAGASYLTIDWNAKLRQQEKSLDNEKNVTTVYYKYMSDDVENLNERKDDEESLKTSIKWISFKQQFFSSTLIAQNDFASALVRSTAVPEGGRNMKSLEASINVEYNLAQGSSIPFRFYFGPNKFNTLKKYKLDLEDQIPLGWGILSWINKFAVIPVFDFLEGFNLNYGIIILILTILLKIVLFPVAYKTYISSAKMKVLKPEVDAIGAKFTKKDDALKKQQAIMELYKKAGANPMSGCLPMLLQLPILIALFRFFPASIELRQQPFLWAEDLSSYDSVLDLPFTIPFYGDHVSLFTLLMTISTIIYTHMSSQMMSSSNQMPGMKTMMYLMPIMFLGFFNSYSSGLSYYYLLANLITFGQMYIFRKIINEDKLHKRIEENKKKPIKKSGFQKRLEDMAKQRGYQAPKK